MDFIVNHSKLAIFILCAFFSTKSYASIVRVQVSSAATVGTSLPLILSSNPNDGDNEVISIGTTNPGVGAVTSISQTGATWVKAVETSNPGVETEIWYAEGILAAGTTVTINTGSTLSIAAVMAEYSGLMTSSSFDVSASSFGNLSTGNPFTGTTATTAQPNELWFAGLTHSTIVNTGSSDFTSFSNSFSLVNQAVIGIFKDGAADSIVSSVGTASTTGSYTGTFFADTWAGVIATFKASTGALPVQPLTLEGMGG